MSTRGRIPALTGLRAIAVAVVIFGHIINAEGANDSGTRTAVALGDIAGLGVGLFFAISGFLITRLLIAERARTGSISLRLFYARRVIRLWPALWSLLAGVAVMSATGLVDVGLRDYIVSAFFVSDYFTPTSRVLLHTWSLAIEEQFYLLWPLLLTMLGRRSAPRWLAVGILAAPLVRLASRVALPAMQDHAQYQFHQRYDTLAVGCLIALVWDTPTMRRLLLRGRVLMLCGLALVGVSLFPGLLTSGKAAVVVTSLMPTVQAVGFGLIVAGAVKAAPRVLELKPVRHVGRISYSLYLWQQPFLIEDERVVSQWWLGLLLAVGVAEASYRFVERPFEKVRQRLTPIDRKHRAT